MTVSIDTLSTSIAALSITVTKPDGTTGTLAIRSLSTMEKAIINRECPVLYPQYDYATGINYERQGVGTDPCWQVTYTLNYYYAHSEVGRGRWNAEHSAKIAANSIAIAEKIAEQCAALGVTQIHPSSIGNPGIVPGPDDRQFYGAEIALEVIDYRNL